MNPTPFPLFKGKCIPERDSICHSIMEASHYKKITFEFISSMLLYLEQYNKNICYDFIVDTVFFNFILKFKDEIREISQNMFLKIPTSQYTISLFIVCFSDPDLKEELMNQSWKIFTNEVVYINKIILSNCLTFNLLKYINNYFSDDWLLDENKFIDSEEVNQIFNNIYHPPENNIFDNDKIILKSYSTIGFWESFLNSKVLNDNLIIDVHDNHFLFNGAVILNYLNPSIKFQYCIRKLHFPEEITYDIVKLINRKYDIKDLLEFKTVRMETKNICTLLYILIKENVSIERIKFLETQMKPRSFMILMLIYANYNDSIKDDYLIDLITENINLNNSYNDFILTSILFKKTGENISKDNLGKFAIVLYMMPDCLINNKVFSLNYSLALYSIVKRDVFVNKCSITEQAKIIEKNQKDFERFLISTFQYSNLDKNISLISRYADFIDSPMFFEKLFNTMITNKEYDKIIDIFSNAIKDGQIHLGNTSIEINQYKKYLINHQFQKSTPLDYLKKTHLIDLFDLEERLRLYSCKKEKTIANLTIDRNNILWDSINICKHQNMINKTIHISYKNEQGFDAGGLRRDWFTNVSQKIIESGVFIPTPNGNTFTFNPNKYNGHIIEFTGKLIAFALSNNTNIPIRLSSWIWKFLLNEEITLDDINDYDSEIYRSLKWISENDPEQLNMTFTNSFDMPLIRNGDKIFLNESNKNEYIKLMIKDILIKSCNHSMHVLKSGFLKNANTNRLKMFLTSNDVKMIANGTDFINVEEWKKYTIYSPDMSDEINKFFNIISLWPQDKLGKLLKFITGSSVVPAYGFNDYKNRGGSISIRFMRNPNNLPVSHTCNNSIELPRNCAIDTLERKLLMAIEYDSFEFS